MSTPRTLALPASVRAERIETPHGSFAAHTVRPAEAWAHVLLIPGWTGSKEDFTQLLPLLGEAGLAATAYDQRGQYESTGDDDEDFSLAGLAADALAIATAAHPGDRSHLLGHSFGGLVAQTAAIAVPEAWRSLSLLCTGPGALGSSPGRPLDRLVEALDGPAPIDEVYEALRGASLGTNPAPIEDFLRERFRANSRVGLRALTQHLLDAPDRVDSVAATGLPVWVGRGAGDDAWPHAVQEEMATRLGTTVHVIEGADHSPGVENPAGLAAVWLPFLQHH